MTISVVTPPAVTPIECVGLSAIKNHLRVAADLTDEDDLISAYVATAWDYAQRVTWRQLLTATLQLSLPTWLCPIPLPKPPVASITSVKYFDGANELQTWDAANWESVFCGDVTEIYPAYGATFPTLYPRTDAVQIEYTAGYGITSASMPPALLHAVRLLTGQYYEAREEISKNSAAEHLLATVACRDERLTMLL